MERYRCTCVCLAQYVAPQVTNIPRTTFQKLSWLYRSNFMLKRGDRCDFIILIINYIKTFIFKIKKCLLKNLQPSSLLVDADNVGEAAQVDQSFDYYQKHANEHEHALEDVGPDYRLDAALVKMFKKDD